MWMRSATSKTCGMLWLMRTIGRPRFFDVEDELQHPPRLLDAERRRRLVHDDDAAAEGRGARDRDALALAARERLHRLVDVLDREQAQLGRASRAPPAACARGRACGTHCPSDARLAQLAAEEQFVGDARAPATAPGSGRPSRCRPRVHPCGERKLDRLAVEPDLAGIGNDRAGERLDQGRLAGAVVADDGEDLAGIELEIGVVERVTRP